MVRGLGAPKPPSLFFFDPRLSASGVTSCNACHNLGTGGDDNLPTSVGHGWQKGPRNAPTVLNAVFNKAQFWDGRAEDLKAQAKGPVQAGVEMANKPAAVVATLTSMPEYVERFGKAFPGEADPVTFDNMAKAIEAFEATLVTPSSPFDQWLEGNDAALTAPYFHSGQVWELKQAAEIMGNAQLGTELVDQEAALIAAFLEGLTGEQPKVEYPILPVETAKTPKPTL